MPIDPNNPFAPDDPPWWWQGAGAPPSAPTNNWLAPPNWPPLVPSSRTFAPPDGGPPDAFAAYWSRVPADSLRQFAFMAPIFPDALGRFPRTPPAPTSFPRMPIPTGGILGDLPKHLAALANPDATPFPKLFGGQTKPPPTDGPASSPNTQTLPPSLGDQTQGSPNGEPFSFPVPPFDPDYPRWVADPLHPGRVIPRIVVRPYQPPSGQPAGVNGSNQQTAPTQASDGGPDDWIPAGTAATFGTPASASPTPSGGGASFAPPAGAAPPEMPGVFEAFWQGLGSGTRQVGQTVQSLSDSPDEATESSPAAKPLHWSDLANPSQIAPKLAYGFAQSYPTLAGGVAGGYVGGELGGVAGPEGAAAGSLIGGSLGAAAMSAVQTLGPVYAAELRKTPSDPEDAWNRAWRQAEISGAFSGASWAVFPARFFQGPVKNLVFQIFGAQPALAVGERATRNIAEGRPASEDLGEAYVQGAAGTAVPALGQHIVDPFPTRRAPASKPSIDQPKLDVSGGPLPAEQLKTRRAAQLKINSATGTAWENTTSATFDRGALNVASQLTVKLPSGIRTRLDFVTRNRVTGEFGRVESKGSATARVRPKQAKAFREMEQHPATVVGKGKPGFPGGTKIPPGPVEIRRPRK